MPHLAARACIRKAVDRAGEPLPLVIDLSYTMMTSWNIPDFLYDETFWSFK